MRGFKFLLLLVLVLAWVFGGYIYCVRARADVASDLGFKVGDTIGTYRGTVAPSLGNVAHLYLGVSEDKLRDSLIFSYSEAGHFGDKTQYDAKVTDEYGNTYTAHCRQGICYGIEVKSSRPLKLVSASSVCRRLVSHTGGRVTSIDIDDFEHKDADVNCIYVYFTTCHCEIIFQKGSDTDVAQIRVWLDK